MARSPDHLHARILELGVPVLDQESASGQEPIDGVGQVANDLGHERLARIRRRPNEVDPPRLEIDHEEHGQAAGLSAAARKSLILRAEVVLARHSSLGGPGREVSRYQ